MGAGSGADIVSVSLADAGWMGGRKSGTGSQVRRPGFSALRHQ